MKVKWSISYSLKINMKSVKDKIKKETYLENSYY